MRQCYLSEGSPNSSSGSKFDFEESNSTSSIGDDLGLDMPNVDTLPSNNNKERAWPLPNEERSPEY
jgi:hypothetical protein